MPQDDSGRKLCSKQRKTLSVSHRNGEWVLLGKKKPFNMTASSSVGREVTTGEAGKTMEVTKMCQETYALPQKLFSPQSSSIIFSVSQL